MCLDGGLNKQRSMAEMSLSNSPVLAHWCVTVGPLVSNRNTLILIIFQFLQKSRALFPPRGI